MATTGFSVQRTTIRSPRQIPPSSVARRLVVGLSPLLALYVVYTLIRWLLASRGESVGVKHAMWLLDFERWLGIDWEQSLQQRALDHLWLIKAANIYYVYGFLPVLIVAAVLSAWRAPAAFEQWRRVFAISLGLALPGYAFFPLAPPRLLPASHGYVDTLLLYGPRYYGDATGSSFFNAYGSLPSTVNVYAAMPSMHVAWSVIAGILLCAVLAGRWWMRLIAVVHPTLMSGAVVVTANHYLLDVVAGLIVLLAAIWLSRRWQRRKSDHPGTLATSH
ncbi:MAG TPA: phosphatase PAP2 family protein [Thermomicrobiales bacterium]